MDYKKVMAKYKWQARMFQPNDLASYIQMVIYEYGPHADIAKEEYINWQYFCNPAGPALINLAIAKNNQVVGSYCLIPIRLIIAGQLSTGRLSVNTITNQEYRGKGIFIILAKILLQEYAGKEGQMVTFGFPNNKSAAGFIDRLGFKEAGSIPILFKINNLGTILKTFIPFMPARLINFAGALLTKWHCIKTSDDKITCEDINHFDARFDELWEKNKAVFKNMVVRDSLYLNWRYCGNPLRSYKIFAAVDKSHKIVGYIVIRLIQARGVHIGLIGDLFTENNDQEIAEVLIKKAIGYLYQSKTDLFATIMFRHTPYFRVLKKQGFLICPKILEPQPVRLVIRAEKSTSESIYRPDNWYMTMGDYDVF